MPFTTFPLVPGARLHVKPTKQFKTATVKLFLARNLDSHTTHAALIPYILRRGTKNYPSMNRISRRLEELYGTAVSADVGKIGDRQVISFGADVPNERYLPTRVPLLKRALEFLRELAFEPAGDDGFVEKHFEMEKTNMINFIRSLSENKSSYAVERLIREMCRGEPYARYEYGSVEKLNRIKATELYEFYKLFRLRAMADIYLVGDVEPEKVFEMVRDVFRFSRNRSRRLSGEVVKPARRGTLEVSEQTDIAQARLLMGYRADVHFRHKLSDTLAMAAAVFGGFPHSKLFRVVRERSSLAYSVSAHMIRTKGIMLVYAGVEPGNENKARRLVEDQFEKLRSGEISDFELEATKSAVLSELAAITDSPAREIEFHYIHLLHESRLTPEQAAKKLQETTKEDIAAAARRLRLDTVFILTRNQTEKGRAARSAPGASRRKS